MTMCFRLQLAVNVVFIVFIISFGLFSSTFLLQLTLYTTMLMWFFVPCHYRKIV